MHTSAAGHTEKKKKKKSQNRSQKGDEQNERNGTKREKKMGGETCQDRDSDEEHAVRTPWDMKSFILLK